MTRIGYFLALCLALTTATCGDDGGGEGPGGGGTTDAEPDVGGEDDIPEGDPDSSDDVHLSDPVEFDPDVEQDPDASSEPDVPIVGETWTILVYMISDNDLEKDGVSDVQEMLTVESGGRLRFVTQMDRADGFFEL